MGENFVQGFGFRQIFLPMRRERRREIGVKSVVTPPAVTYFLFTTLRPIIALLLSPSTHRSSLRCRFYPRKPPCTPLFVLSQEKMAYLRWLTFHLLENSVFVIFWVPFFELSLFYSYFVFFLQYLYFFCPFSTIFVPFLQFL